jgi:hypothetical protein
MVTELDKHDPVLGSLVRLALSDVQREDERLRDEAIVALKFFRAIELNGHYLDDEWHTRLGSLRDAADRLLEADTVRVPVVDQPIDYALPGEMPGCRHRAEDACAACVPDLAPAALVDNRRAEVERLGGAS